MTIKPVFSLLALALCVAGASTSAQPAPAMCRTGPGQAFVGDPATQESGAAIIAATGATLFQWVFEGSAVTMDFRENRIRVVYNRAMKIVAITCG